MPLQLIKTAQVVSCVTPTNGAAGSAAIEGSVIDFAGYHGATIIVQMGAIVTGAATSIKFQHGDAANLSDAADVVGTSQTIADDDDGEIFVIDVSFPQKRYGRLYVSRATQNATVASAIAVVYGAAVQPTAQPSGVTVETHIGAAAGTA